VGIALVLTVIPAQADVSVTISKSQQQMAVSVDGAPPMIWTVSTGRSGYTTPSGNFRAIRLERVYYSKKFDDAPMPNSVFFYGGYAIHGTFEESKLGRPVSHGCVRLARVNAAQLFALVREHGMSRTHITITDAPLRTTGVPMARGLPDGRGYERSLAARSAPGRYVDPPPRYADRPLPVYRGFEQFGRRDGGSEPRYGEPRRRVEWQDEQPRSRYRTVIVPGREYSEAEIRRLLREEGYR
jgi:hypothetical protein